MNQTSIVKSSVKISDEIFEFYDYLADNYMLPELRNRIKKNQNYILRETFQRGWMGFFKNKQKSHFLPFSKNKKKEGVVEEKLTVCPNVFKIESVETHGELVKKVVTPKPTKKEPNPTPHLREFIEKKPNAILDLNCVYSEKLLTVKPISVEIKYDEKNEADYLTQLDREFNAVKRNFESNYTKAMFLSNLFDTLAANGYTVIEGKDALNMAAIYPNISRYFPDFKLLSKTEKLVLLNQSAIKGRKSSKKDIYTFAYATFYELLKANCINTFVKFDSASGKVLTYKKIKEYFEYTYAFKKKEQVPNKSNLLFVTYARPQYSTSFDAGTLWGVLARKGNEHMS